MPPPLALPLDLDSAYRRFGEAVLHRARRILRDDARAQDALQETFLRAHRYAGSFQGGSVLSWLFAIADRVCFDALGRRTPVATDDAALQALVDGDAVESPLAQRPRSVDARLLQDELVAQVLASIDDETRAILVHRYVDEIDTAAIAVRLDTSERTVRRRLERFFERARRRVGAGAATEAP